MSNEIILVVDDNRQISEFLSESMLPGLGYECNVQMRRLLARLVQAQ